MMVATLLEPDLEHLEAAMRSLEATADAFEIRFDALKKPVAPRDVRRLTQKPLIGTVRRPADGGKFSGAEHDRLELLEHCLEAGFEHVDVEGPTTVPGPEERMIRSRHEFRGAPAVGNILQMASEIQRNGATFKFAAATNSFADTLQLLAATRRLQETGKPFALMGLGDYPRAFSHLMGNRLVYGGGRSNAPGQPAIADVHATWTHWGRPEAAPVAYAVVGDPIAHSLSPRMHNAGLRKEGIAAAYGALRVPSGLELQMLLARCNELGVAGLSVTTPLKDAAFDLVPTQTPQAEAAQAVNAIRIEHGKATGHNTDGVAARTLIGNVAKPGARILLAGTGGAARAVASACQDYQVTVAGRNDSTLRKFAARFGVERTTLAAAGVVVRNFDVVVNATRVEEPLPIDGFRGALFDLHYGAKPTPWESYASRHEVPFIGGKELLLEQGCLAFEFWTRRAPARAAMAHAIGVEA